MSKSNETKISRRLLLCNILKIKMLNTFLSHTFFPACPLTFDFNQKKSLILVLMTLDLLFQSLILAHVAHDN